MACRNELSPVFKPLIILFEYLDEGLSFSRPQPANKLDQIGGVRVIDCSIYVHSHLIDSIDKFNE